MYISQRIGNTDLLAHPNKTAFLCSSRVPTNRYWESFQWVDSLNSETDCVICTNTSYLEKEVVNALCENEIPVILVVTKKFPYQDHFGIQRALDKGKVLILEVERESTEMGETVNLRNRFICAQAKNVVLGYMRKGGHIEKLFKGKANVTTALDCLPPIAAEEIHDSQRRWTIVEDKRLMLSYYNDRGIHYIHKDLNRSYVGIKNRINQLVVSHELVEGAEFEAFILGLLQVQRNDDLVLREWRSDKSLVDVIPESNHYPDLVFRQHFDDQIADFAIECKWRSDFDYKDSVHWAEKAQLENYKQFSLNHHIPVFLALGIGGDPSFPQEVYIIPLDLIGSTTLTKNGIAQYRRPDPHLPMRFYWQEQQLMVVDVDERRTQQILEARKLHPEAYARWNGALDEQLMAMCNSGYTIADMVRVFGRSRGSVESRLKKVKEVVD